MNEGRMIDAHSPGKAGLIVGLAEQMGVAELFNETLSSSKGRREDVPYGILALMMMVNMCDDHHPLCRMDEYYGVVADAQVLSGHTDDKTWNSENLDRAEDLLASLNINKDTFYYIADSALFSEENLKKPPEKRSN